MQNPFATIEEWLRRIEAQQKEILKQLDAPSSTLPEIGGIELACEVLRLGKARIYALVSERALPHMKRGNRLSFSRDELLNWMKDGSRKIAAPDSYGTTKARGHLGTDIKSKAKAVTQIGLSNGR
jgi:excisionase family DNA binding protein